MPEIKKVCVITGTRAEYGLLRPLMAEIRDRPDMDLVLVATGMHLSPEFGATVSVIEQDGFTVDAKVDMLISSDQPQGIAKSVGVGTIGFADVYGLLQPDMVVVLGDRYEILAAVQSAYLMHIPVAHIHGGETTLGALDDGIRHAISHMSSIHLPTAEPYRQRLVAMGLPAENIFTISAPGLENLVGDPVINIDGIGARADLDLSSGFFLVTYHPETDTALDQIEALDAMLGALDQFPDLKILLTKSNSDEGGFAINRRLEEYVADKADRCTLFTNMGQDLYLSALRHAACVIGNSSSGIIEAPAVDTPTVNIGDRQKGRLYAESVVSCPAHMVDIGNAIRHTMNADFRNAAKHSSPPYGRPQKISKKIADILSK